jgi:hypothetical protein
MPFFENSHQVELNLKNGITPKYSGRRERSFQIPN